MAIFLVMMILLLLVLVLLRVARNIKADFFAAETVSFQPGENHGVGAIIDLNHCWCVLFAEALLNAFAHARLDLSRANTRMHQSFGGTIQSCCSSLSLSGIVCTDNMRTISVASQFMGRLHAFLEYASLRSRFVWHAGIRRVPSMYLAREPHTGIILRAHHRNRADGEVLSALRDLKYGSSASAAAEEDIVFDEKGNILTKLSGFEFGAYLAERTEATIAALIELPPEIWLAELALATVSFFLIQIPEELMFAVFIGLALCMPALLFVLQCHLAWVRKQLVMPVLFMRAERHAASTMLRFKRAEDSRSSSPAAPPSLGQARGSLSPGRAPSSQDLRTPLLRPTAKPAVSLNGGGAAGADTAAPGNALGKRWAHTPKVTEAEYFKFDEASVVMHKKKMLRMQIKQPTLRRLDSAESSAEGEHTVRQMHSRKLPILAHVPPYLQVTRATTAFPNDSAGGTGDGGARSGTAAPQQVATRKLRRAQGLSDADLDSNKAAQIRLFWCGTFGPAIYLFLFRFAVFTTAVYCGAFAVAAGPAVIASFRWWAAGLVFLAALLPVVLVVVTLRNALPHYVIVTSVEHLKAPREVERVIGLAKLRKALKALRFLLTLMHQAQEIGELIEQHDRTSKQQTAKLLRQGAVAARQKRASMTGGAKGLDGGPPIQVTTRTRRGSQLWKKVQGSLQRDGEQRKPGTPKFGSSGGGGDALSASANKFAVAVNALRLARKLLPDEVGDSSSDEDGAGGHMDYAVATEGLVEVDIEAAGQLQEALAPHVAESSSPRRRRKKRTEVGGVGVQPEELELLDAEEGLCAAWGELCWHRCCHRSHHSGGHHGSEQHGKTDIAASMVIAQQEQVVRISRSIRDGDAAAASLEGGSPLSPATPVTHHHALHAAGDAGHSHGDSSGDSSSDDEGGADADSNYTVLTRDGTTFRVPARLAKLNLRRRQRDDIYNAFDLIDTDSSGYLTVQELQQLLDSLGVRWGTDNGAGHAVRAMYRLMRYNLENGEGLAVLGAAGAGDDSARAAWASGDVMDFPLFLSWALRLEEQEVPLQQLAHVFIRELGRGREHLTPTAFHKALTALGLQISLEDVRELFMEHNPDSRPDMLTLAGLKDMLQTHL